MSEEVAHHKRFKYCRTRPQYRQGKKLTAVKVYTVANESRHLLIFGVPRINLQQEIKRALQRHGEVCLCSCVTDVVNKKVEVEQFTDVYHAQFGRLEHARRAKRFLDAQVFYGGILHLSYAPEYETTTELRNKLKQRQSEVAFRMRINAQKAYELQQKEITRHNDTT